MSRLARRVLGISPDEVRVERRGFRADDPRVRERLETIGTTFVSGYHTGLLENRPGPLATRLGEGNPELRGFAFEGAAMALALTDALVPWRRSAWRAFRDGAGDAHAYMLHVGAGWALARAGVPVRRVLATMDPLLRWLAFDGWGFHQGYFQPRRAIDAHEVPAAAHGYERRAFDQGLGRALWFAQGAGPERVAAVIARFPGSRHADLWSGVGLACAYAGGADRSPGADRGFLETLAELADEHAGWLAQGAAFAAKARARAGNPAAHTRAACEVLCGVDDAEAALVTDQALASLGTVTERDDGAAYDAWRRETRERLVASRADRRTACPAR